MVIREVRPGDAAEWLRMRNLLWPDDAAPAEADGGPHARDIASFFAGSTLGTCPGGLAVVVFVADRGDGRLGGFVEAGLRPFATDCESRPVGFLEGWFVDQDLRRTGVGADLVRGVAAWTREQGCSELASDCLGENAIRQRAHASLGFKEVGRVVEYKKVLVTLAVTMLLGGCASAGAGAAPGAGAVASNSGDAASNAASQTAAESTPSPSSPGALERRLNMLS